MSVSPINKGIPINATLERLKNTDNYMKLYHLRAKKKQ